MRKVVAAMNMTLDGFCDHTSMGADDEIHQHYAELLKSGGTLVYGRVTYQLMEDYWPVIAKNPTGNQQTDEFAAVIDQIPKIIFSRTLKKLDWETASLAKRSIGEELQALKQEPGKDILIGSPSLIVASLNLHLVDELQISIHPTIVGEGLALFKTITDRINLRLIKTKQFKQSGAMALYYEPVKK